MTGHPQANAPVIDFLNALGHAMWDCAQQPAAKYTVPRTVPLSLLRGFRHPADTDDQAVINDAIRQRIREYAAADELARLANEMGLYDTKESA